MRNKILTYNELLQEEEKLKELFDAQKSLLSYEIDDLKKELEPALNILNFLKKISLKNSENPVIQAAINMLIDLLIEKLNGPDAGFIKTTIIPGILKKYSSTLFAVHSN